MTTQTQTAKTKAAIRRELPQLKTPPIAQSAMDAPTGIAKYAREYESLRGRAAAAIERVVALEASRPEREAADRAAYVVAVRADKKDPGSPNIDALNDELPPARREAEAFVGATRKAWSDLKEALREHLPQWREKLHDRRAKLAAVAEEHLDAVDRAVNDVATANATLEYMDCVRRAVGGDYCGDSGALRRFPSGQQDPNTNINVGTVTYDVPVILAGIRAVFAGGSEA